MPQVDASGELRAQSDDLRGFHFQALQQLRCEQQLSLHEPGRQPNIWHLLQYSVRAMDLISMHVIGHQRILLEQIDDDGDLLRLLLQQLRNTSEWRNNSQF